MRIVQRGFRFGSLCWALAAIVSCAPFAGQPAPPKIGEVAPDFTLPSLGGRTIALSEQRGQVVIVNFWASWCGPCASETPRLVAWYNQHRPRGLVILGVDSLYLDSHPSVAAFATENKVSYPILLDGEGNVSKQWRAQQLPRTYIVDRQGIVRFMRIGELTESDFEKEVAPLLQ
jgi:peroxiredoxin